MTEIQIDGERYVFTAIAATAIGVSSEYIGRLCRQGKLKARRFAGQWLFSLTSLEDFLSHRNHKAL
ncbi:MAG: helix-turn-helix domain-containing protein [Alphaproteobacteria bacterium]|nr:helix-turn-helix domain-containing protein [Alphaproteobacteria bacterium]